MGAAPRQPPYYCPHFPLEILERAAPVGCTECGGWVSESGLLMSTYAATVCYPGAALERKDPPARRLRGLVRWTRK